jgi:hypothetical protein
MPIISTLNVGKRVVENEATIYSNDPRRTLLDASEEEEQIIENIYKQGKFNTKLQKTNKYFKYRNQSFLQVLLKDKKIQARVLLGHNIDIIPDSEDPEKPYALITSSYDRSLLGNNANSDGVNQAIADNDDWKMKQKYVVWTNEYNFIMNGLGEYETQPVPNSLGVLPFVDSSTDKDYEFFIRTGMNISNFTVQYNALWSDFFYIMKMQGFAIPVFTGNPELMPREYFVGPNRGIMLPNDPTNPEGSLKMEFLSPNPNLDGSLKGVSAFLANWLTSRGVSPKVISSELNASDSYASGIERLLAMIDKFEATKEDFDLYQCVEQDIFEIIKKYLVVFSGTDLLDKKYSVSKSFENAQLSVQFHKPEMVQTENEKITNIQLKMDMGISDQVIALMELEGITEEMAIEKIDMINERKAIRLQTMVDQNQPQDNGNVVDETKPL